MMNKHLALLTTICLSFIPITTIRAEETVSHPVKAVITASIGGERAYDSYLSSVEYSGTALSLTGRWLKAIGKASSGLVISYNGRIDAGLMSNPRGNSNLYDLKASFSFALSRRWKLPCRLLLSAGGAAEISAGAFYLPRNTNNPASARAAFTIAPRLSAAYPVKIGNLPLLLSEEVEIPSSGIFFAPAYGETYYEIYLGNRSGLVHPAWWGNRFRLYNMLAADLDIGPAALRIGWSLRCGSQSVSGNVSDFITNSFVIGVIPGGIGLRKKPKTSPVVSINAFYPTE